MKVKVVCSCGKAMAVDAQHAGKKGKCPVCENVFVIPHPPAQPEPAPAPQPAEVLPDHIESGPQLCPNCDGAVDAGMDICGACGYDFRTGEIQSNAKDCPGCKSEVDAEAVICINCGYNFNTGQQLSTSVEELPPEEEEEEEEDWPEGEEQG